MGLLLWSPGRDFNSLLQLMYKEYSAYREKHFNHTNIHRGTCINTSCKEYHNDALNKTEDLETLLEACINGSIWRRYKIEASLSKLQYCKRNDDRIDFDASDYIVAAVYIVLIMINIIGSFYDIYFCEKDSNTGNPYLLAFSIRRNWSKLIAPGGSGPEPRMMRLKLFNGLRAMTIVCVIFSHTALIMTFSYIANPHYVETAYDDISKQILFNGSLVTLTFFVMSSFLLAYNLLIHSEKNEITWTQIPKGILLRWIRLTPAYALTIATIATLMRHFGSGPLWDMVVVSEANYCRQYWWANIFYFNNYIYKDDICFPQAWYLAADTQLFCVSLILLVLVQKPRHRKVMLILLFLVSLLITAGHTYFQDLDAVVIQTPESYRRLYTDQETFLQVYIRGHTNFSVYIIGLAGGILSYQWQTNDKDFSKHKKKYRWFFWLLFPLGVATILSGGIFYIDGVTPSVVLKVVYATLYKPVFQTLVMMFTLGVIFKIETLYRGIIEWRGFTWAGRVSYSAFLLHSLFQRALAGAQTAPLVMSDYFVFLVLSASIFLSFACGAVLWLAVEAPVGGLTRALLAPRQKKV